MRRANGGLGLVAAMESEKAKAAEENKDKVLGDNAESLETDLAEVNDSAAEGDSQQAEIDGAQEAATALESLIISLEGINGNGGLDQGGAMILDQFSQYIYKPLGIESRSVPALESFGGANSRVEAGTIALEDFKDRLKEIWAAIVAAIKKAINWVKGHWNAVFGAAEKLSKRAAALQERSQTSGVKKEASFENDRLAKSLAIGNAPVTNVIQHAKDLKEIVSAMVTKGAEVSKKLGEEAVNAIEHQEGAKIGQLLSLVQPLAGEKVANPDAEGLAAPGEGLALYRSKQLFGGQALFSRVPDAGAHSAPDGQAAAKAISLAGYSISKFSKDVKDPTNKKLVTLSTTDCGSLAGIVKEIAEELVAYKKNATALGETQDKLVKAAEKVANSAGSEEDEAKRKEMGSLQGVANAANRILTVPGTQVSKYAINTGKALLDYVELSLKQYGEK